MAKQIIVEGQTATNPATGERIVYRGGKWFPLNADGSGGPAPTARLAPQERAQLSELRNSANQMREMASQAQQFDTLNRKAGTGPIYKIPGVSEVASLFNPEVAQMDALTSRMAPQQRVPGSGTTSDRDLALFLKSVPSLDRPGEANAAIARDMQATAKRRESYATFMDQYAKKNGTLLGAEEAYQATLKTAKKTGGAIYSQQANAAYQARLKGGKIDRTKPLGTQAHPYIARTQADADALSPGSYVILPDGSFGVVE
jgi:hypothetical protein